MKRVNYLSCIEGKVGLKDFQCIAQNAALIVDLLLLQNIFDLNEMNYDTALHRDLVFSLPYNSKS